jgi:hypothetical protein
MTFVAIVAAFFVGWFMGYYSGKAEGYRWAQTKHRWDEEDRKEVEERKKEEEARRNHEHRGQIIQDNVAAGRHWLDGLSEEEKKAPGWHIPARTITDANNEADAHLRWEQEQHKREMEERRPPGAPRPPIT